MVSSSEYLDVVLIKAPRILHHEIHDEFRLLVGELAREEVVQANERRGRLHWTITGEDGVLGLVNFITTKVFPIVQNEREIHQTGHHIRARTGAQMQWTRQMVLRLDNKVW